MKRFAKAIAALIAFVIAVPLLSVAIYYATVFLPRQDEIQAVLAGADPLDRVPPPQIQVYISVMHREGASVSNVVSRQVIHRFLPRTTTIRQLAREALWTCLLPLHFSEEQLMGLYATLAYNGHGNGLNALSNRIFSKPLDALSEQEAATVVAYTKAPGIFEQYPGLLTAQRDRLLSVTQGKP